MKEQEPKCRVLQEIEMAFLSPSRSFLFGIAFGKIAIGGALKGRSMPMSFEGFDP